MYITPHLATIKYLVRRFRSPGDSDSRKWDILKPHEIIPLCKENARKILFWSYLTKVSFILSNFPAHVVVEGLMKVSSFSFLFSGD